MHEAVNLVSTLPVGPFRCLAMMSSAMPLLVAVAEIVVVAIDEDDRVGVLLDGAGLAQIAELGALVFGGAGLDRAVQLGERDDRHAHLLGELLQTAGQLADLLLAAARVAPPCISCR